jgi:hypothetical protein
MPDRFKRLDKSILDEFYNKGYVVFNELFKEHLNVLRSECDFVINSCSDRIIADRGCVLELSVTNACGSSLKEYICQRECEFEHSFQLESLIDACAFICKQLLNTNDLYLMNEQYVVKPPISVENHPQVFLRRKSLSRNLSSILIINTYQLNANRLKQLAAGLH